MAWWETEAFFEDVLDDLNIRYVKWNYSLYDIIDSVNRANAIKVSCTMAARNGNSMQLRNSASIGLSKYLFVVARKSYEDINPLTFLIESSYLNGRNNRCINVTELHKYSLDIIETLQPNSIEAVLSRTELVSVNDIIAA